MQGNETNVMFCKYIFSFVITCLVCASVQSCTVIARFSQPAYDTAESIRFRSLALMDSAVNSYSAQSGPISSVTTSVNQAYASEQQRSRNTATIAMWNKMQDSSEHLLGGFIKRWRTEGRLSPVFIQNEQQIIKSAFDQMLQLEKSKPGGK